jgi:16S rRNA (guanine(1405)-N(7))-methyltransferase
VNPELETLIAEVCSSARYRAISPPFVRTVAQAELAKRRSHKETLKAIKSKLHQVAGVFLDGKMEYAAALSALAAASGDDVALRRCCATLMAAHASTRERLSFLAPFYQRIFAHLGPIRSVLDLGCGLNPLAIPWMPLAADAVYHAYDVHGDLVQFLAAALNMLGVAGTAQLGDLMQDMIDQPADLAFLLKLLPTLEQLDRTAGARVLARLNVQHMVVSFPIRSLGGREKGMRITYETHFRHMIADRPWQVERLEFPTELVFVVTT